jgi:pSer/pThr/pTyr-binding forkhead associated (FHA) protein
MPRVTITAPDANSQPYRFQLDHEVVQIGRGSENGIVVDNGSVSTLHAEMRRVLGGYELHDLGSTNGLKQDGVRYPYVSLFHGSTVFLGDVAFEFSLTDEEQAVLASEVPADPGVTHVPVPDAPISTQPMAHAVRPRPVPRRQVIRVEEDSGGGFLAAIILILFAAVAFGIGAGIRHQKETGGSIIDHIKAKREGKVPAPTTAQPPADPAAAPAPVQMPVPVVPMPSPVQQGDGKPLPLPGAPASGQ